MAKGRAKSKSPARSARGSGARSTSRARNDAKRKPELKTGHGAAEKKSKKSEPKATVAVKVAKKKADGENAPVGGGFAVHGAAAGAWALIAFTVWSNHKDALVGATGLLSTVDVLTYAVAAPLYFAISFLAIQQNNKDLEGWRCSIFNSVLFPLAAGMFVRSLLVGQDTDGKFVKAVHIDGTAPTTFDGFEGEGNGYSLVANREHILGLSLFVEIFLVDFGKTTITTSVVGAFKGMLAFVVFTVFCNAKGDPAAIVGEATTFVTDLASKKEDLIGYMTLAVLGLAVRLFYENFIMTPLAQGTGDAEVVQAKHAIHGTGASEEKLKAKKYDNILIDSKNAHKKK